MSDRSVNEFIERAIQSGGWMILDKVFLENRIKTLIGDTQEEEVLDVAGEKTTHELLVDLLKTAEKNGHLSLFDEKRRIELTEELMELLTPPPSVVNALFSQYYDHSEEEATNYYHELNQENGYINSNDFEPEQVKIAHHEMIIQKKTPGNKVDNQCQKCFQSEGAGLGKNRIKRIIRMNLKGESWGFFYESTPLVEEHSLFAPESHQSIGVNRESFETMLRLIDIYPQYFVSYDALKNKTKDHGFFFGGKKTIPLITSEDDFKFDIPGFVTVKASLVDWPLSVIRLRTTSKKNLVNSIEYLTLKWQQYSFPSLDIIATNEEGKNLHSVIPIFRKEQEEYIVDLILVDQSKEFERTPDYETILFDKETVVDKMGVINIQSDVAVNEQLIEVIKTNFLKQQIFKKSPEGKTAFIRFIDTL